MITHHVILHTSPVGDGLTFHSPSVARPATITPLTDATGYRIDIPEGDGVDICIAGFRVNDVAYSIAAVTYIEGRPDTAWGHSGADALSPEFSEVADHDVRVTAASDDPAAPRKISPVTMKIRQPGKPDDFLAQFEPG